MRLAGITINDKHTFYDWNLALSSAPIFNAPKVNTHVVSISGGNGFIDYTESLIGEPTYSYRTGTLQFLYLGKREQFHETYNEILSYCHGKTIVVRTDERSGVYFNGQIVVGNPSIKDKKIKLSMTYTFQPFALDEDETVVSKNFSQATSTDFYKLQANDVSKQTWNTDLIFNEGISLATATGFVFSVTDKHLGGNITYYFTDSNRNTYYGTVSWDEAYNEGKTFGWYSNTINDLRTAMTSAGVNHADIRRILLSGAGGVTAYMSTNGLMLDIEGCDRTVAPSITLPKKNMIVECNGASYASSVAGEQIIDGLVIPREGCTIVIGKGSSDATSGVCTVKYRKEWL